VPERFREVVREITFEQEARFLLGGDREADAFVEGAEFILARDPEAGFLIGGDPPLWFMPMAPIEEQQVSLFYTFDERTVFLMGLRLIYPPMPPPMAP
jgi:hypothetical protein